MTTQTLRPSQQTLPSDHEGEVLRYRLGPRISHAIMATSFLLLLTTGLVLFWPPLAQFAAGGFSRWLHRVGAVAYMTVPLLYILIDRESAKELLWDSFHYDRDDFQWLLHVFPYFMGHAADMPPQGRLNAGQKLHHAGIVIFSATVVASGLALWFAKGSLGQLGLTSAALVHDVSMLALTVLMVGHVYFTVVYKALSGMVSGYVPKEEARIEHSKWVEEIEEEERKTAEAEQENV